MTNLNISDIIANIKRKVYDRREEELEFCYEQALSNLLEAINDHPLRSNFVIVNGCESNGSTVAMISKFKKDGFDASGKFGNNKSITISIPFHDDHNK